MKQYDVLITAQFNKTINAEDEGELYDVLYNLFEIEHGIYLSTQAIEIKNVVEIPPLFGKKFGGDIEILDIYYSNNQGMRVRGKLFNDPNKRFDDGAIITTSILDRIDFDELVLVTANSTYRILD